MRKPAMQTRDTYNQEQTHYINGHKISLQRIPASDTVYHVQYRYTLTTKDGAKLFGKVGDTCGIPKAFAGRRSPIEAALLAFSAVTMQEMDTDSEYFADYTPQEIAWRDSKACEYLGYEVSDVEERLSLR